MADPQTTPLPCPFCGGKPVGGDNEDKEWHANTWWIECDDCGARGPTQFNGAERWGDGAVTRSMAQCLKDAVATWNRRQA